MISQFHKKNLKISTSKFGWHSFLFKKNKNFFMYNFKIYWCLHEYLRLTQNLLINFNEVNLNASKKIFKVYCLKNFINMSLFERNLFISRKILLYRNNGLGSLTSTNILNNWFDLFKPVYSLNKKQLLLKFFSIKYNTTKLPQILVKHNKLLNFFFFFTNFKVLLEKKTLINKNFQLFRIKFLKSYCKFHSFKIKYSLKKTKFLPTNFSNFLKKTNEFSFKKMPNHLVFFTKYTRLNDFKLFFFYQKKKIFIKNKLLKFLCFFNTKFHIMRFNIYSHQKIFCIQNIFEKLFNFLVFYKYKRKIYKFLHNERKSFFLKNMFVSTPNFNKLSHLKKVISIDNLEEDFKTKEYSFKRSHGQNDFFRNYLKKFIPKKKKIKKQNLSVFSIKFKKLLKNMIKIKFNFAINFENFFLALFKIYTQVKIFNLYKNLRIAWVKKNFSFLKIENQNPNLILSLFISLSFCSSFQDMRLQHFILTYKLKKTSKPNLIMTKFQKLWQSFYFRNMHCFRLKLSGKLLKQKRMRGKVIKYNDVENIPKLMKTQFLNQNLFLQADAKARIGVFNLNSQFSYANYELNE